jgi:hypothetical protein
MAGGSMPRYTVRARPSGAGHYCVWDAEKNAIASSPDGNRPYDDLRLQEAFDAIDMLAERDEIDPDPKGLK